MTGRAATVACVLLGLGIGLAVTQGVADRAGATTSDCASCNARHQRLTVRLAEPGGGPGAVATCATGMAVMHSDMSACATAMQPWMGSVGYE